MLLIINEYLNKSNQNLVHYLSCQAVRRTAYLNFCGSRMLIDLGLGLEGPGLDLGLDYITAFIMPSALATSKACGLCEYIIS